MDEKTYFLGVDPGRSGGWALIGDNGLINAGPLPYGYNGKHVDRLNTTEFARTVSHAAEPHAYERWVVAIEHPIVRDGESDWGHLNSGINFGKMLAWVEVAVYAHEIYTPMPHIWKQNMRLTKDKDLSVQRAETIFPEFTGFRGPRGGLRDGIAEAALIAEWGRRKFLKIATNEFGGADTPVKTPIAGTVAAVTGAPWGGDAAAFRERHGW